MPSTDKLLFGLPEYERIAASHAATTAVHEDVASGDGLTFTVPDSTAYTRWLAVCVTSALYTSAPAFHASVVAAGTSNVHPVPPVFAAADTVTGVDAAKL